MNLYRKLLLAQAPIAIALTLVGIFSVVAVSYLGSHSQTILKDNYRSVLAAQRMKEAIERMDSGAENLPSGSAYRPADAARVRALGGEIPSDQIPSSTTTSRRTLRSG